LAEKQSVFSDVIKVKVSTIGELFRLTHRIRATFGKQGFWTMARNGDHWVLFQTAIAFH
jgi:hypothetical protein